MLKETQVTFWVDFVVWKLSNTITEIFETTNSQRWNESVSKAEERSKNLSREAETIEIELTGPF